MRDIKFRSKTLKGVWVYGYYAHDTEWGKHYICRQVKGPLYYEMKSVEVDEKTVGQFTGLLDCNDKEIYTGDIIWAPHFQPLLVGWSIEKAAFVGSKTKDFSINKIYNFGDDILVDAEDWQLMGNIFDNPGLFE